MKKNYGNVLWGILLIFIGLGLAGRYLLDWNFTLFFDGWWTLFIIIPCIISMIDTGVHTSNVTVLIVGVLLFLSCQDVFRYYLSWRLIIPLLIIFAGVYIIVNTFADNKRKNFFSDNNNPGNGYFNNTFDNGPVNGPAGGSANGSTDNYANGPAGDSANASTDNYANGPAGDSANASGNNGFYNGNPNFTTGYNGPYDKPFYASFSERTYRLNGRFEGCDAACSFGSLTIDLRNTILTDNCTIRCSCSFGKLRIFIPLNTSASVAFAPTLGNVINRTVSNHNVTPCPTITIQGSCSFGEIEVL